MQRKNGIRNRIGHTKKLWLAGAFLAACFLCGCTRKEELLFLTEEAANEAAAAENGETGGADPGDAASGSDEEALPSKNADQDGTASSLRDERVEGGLLYVHVCGAVQVPGVYELPAGSRVYEAVRAAGGFAEDAEQNYVNQAQVLADGVKLVIPTAEEAAAVQGSVLADAKDTDSGAAAGKENEAALQIGIFGEEETQGKETAAQMGGRININTASVRELCAIPGVGETRAAAIVSYRDTHGGFAKTEDIMKVSGIKEGMYDKIKDSICVD